jgi:hypothetical protein
LIAAAFDAILALHKGVTKEHVVPWMPPTASVERNAMETFHKAPRQPVRMQGDGSVFSYAFDLRLGAHVHHRDHPAD